MHASVEEEKKEEEEEDAKPMAKSARRSDDEEGYQAVKLVLAEKYPPQRPQQQVDDSRKAKTWPWQADTWAATESSEEEVADDDYFSTDNEDPTPGSLFPDTWRPPPRETQSSRPIGGRGAMPQKDSS